MKYLIGIDLGGTNIKAGIVNERGEIIHKDRIKTQAGRDQLEIIKDMGLLASRLLADSCLTAADILAIGIGSPGTPDNQAGVLVYANNLPFRQAPLRREIRRLIDLPVFIENDANVAALAEALAGGARGTRHSVTITLGTGVGGGVIINRRIYSGFNNAGCEIGHIVIQVGGEPCTCGRQGCFEAYASASALSRATVLAAGRSPASRLNRMITENNGLANGRMPFEAMRQGDAAATAVVEHYIEMLSEGLANVVNAYMPEVVVIGGGVCNEGEALLGPVRERVRQKAYIATGVTAPAIRLAELGNDAGIAGAALMAAACLEDGQPG